MEIGFEDTGSGGRYTLGDAHLSFSRAGETRWIADATVVPDAMRGTGAGLAMVERLVADARAAGVTIVALCPFVRAQARRHPEWRDVVE